MNLKNALGALYDWYQKSNELLVDSFDDVYFEEHGKVINADGVLKNAAELEQIAHNLLTFANIHKQANKFHYDFTLDLRTRVNIVFPPMSQKGPSLNILKIPMQSLTWEDMLKWNVIRPEGKQFLEDAITTGKNFIVAGSAGSGKSTLLNIMASTIPESWRVVAIERTPNIILQRKRYAKLMAPNHKKEEMIELIQAAAKMRADYLVHANLEGPESMELLDLIREGHSCMVLTTGENIYDAIKTVEFKVLSCNYSHNIEDIRYKIASAFDYIVFQEKIPDGARKITKIAAISYDEGKIKLEVVYAL